MSPRKEIPCGDNAIFLTAVPRPFPHPSAQSDGNGREASAGVMVIAAGDAACRAIGARLQQQNFPALFTFVTNNDELQSAMNDGDWDIVLIDLPVRSPNLPEIINSIRLHMPAVPVILVADRVDETRARDLFTSGVREFVPRDALDLLVPAIDRSLRTSFLQARSANGQKQLRQKLKESEARFKALADQPLIGTFIIQDGTVKHSNERFAEMFGYGPGELIDTIDLQDLIAPEDRQRIKTLLRRCESRREPAVHEEFRGVKRTGGTINAEILGSRAAYLGRPAVVGIMLDVTEKRSLEQQLRQMQKMEEVGRLTGCIAHDFNNVLSTIVGYASLIAQKTDPDDAARQFAVQILSGADQGAKLIRSLLSFSRKQEPDLRVIDVNEAIRKAENLIRLIMGHRIDLRVSTAARRLLVKADQGQIEQVLMTLATTAADAMPDGGSLSIETDVVSGDLPDSAAGSAPDHYAMIMVTDTGTGMDAETRERIFEPFFTTKDAERGTGLGLSIVSGIVQQHKGSVRCESRPGAGTRFRIYLPLLAFQRKPAEAHKPADLTAGKTSVG